MFPIQSIDMNENEKVILAFFHGEIFSFELKFNPEDYYNFFSSLDHLKE